MGLFKSDAPKPPDPAKTAAAQTATNIGTAIAESKMNQINQVGPDGSLTYSQSGSYNYRDPLTGKVHVIPTMTATTKLSEAQQKIKDQNDGAAFNLASLANTQSGRLQGLLDRPLDMNTDAIEGRLMELGSKRLTPELDRSRASLETRLANQGIKLGSAAYDRAMAGQGEKENDAWNQLLLTGRAQGINELLTQRNQPINEIVALLSGAPVSQPNFVNTPQSSVAGTDYAGLVANNYANQLSNYNAQQAAMGEAIGGMFGLAGKAYQYRPGAPT